MRQRRSEASLIYAAHCVPRLMLRGSRLEVWLMRGDKAIKRTGSVSLALARDARRYGEDLVAELLDAARRELERRQQSRMTAD